jgi:hypothetical protein
LIEYGGSRRADVAAHARGGLLLRLQKQKFQHLDLAPACVCTHVCRRETETREEEF